MQTIQLKKMNLASFSAQIFPHVAKKQAVSQQERFDMIFTAAMSVVVFSIIICLFSAFIPFSNTLFQNSRSSDETILQLFHSAQAEHALAEFTASIDSAEAYKNPELLNQACEKIKTGAVFNKTVSNRFAIKVTDARVFTDNASGKKGIQTTYSIQGRTYTSRAIF